MISIRTSTENINIGYYFFFAILDSVSMYRAFIVDKSLSSAIIVGLALISLTLILNNSQRIKWEDVFFIILYYMWVMVKSNAFYRFISSIVVLNLVATTIKPDRESTFRKVLELISWLAAFCVTLQTIAHYLLGIHIPMVIESLCTSSVQIQYHSAITTGVVVGMYRPCAFFLEPAQYTCCCVFGLLSMLCRDKINFRKSVFVSLGIILTTSGMGIVLTFGLWIWRYIFGASKVGIIDRIKNTIKILFIAVIVFVFLSRFSFFQAAVGRIFGSQNQLGALQGRTMRWDNLFAGHNPMEFLWGFGYDAIPEYYLTGFMSTLYAYGLVGYLLLLLFFLRAYKQGDRFIKMVCALFVALMFVANINGFIYTVFVLGLVLSQLSRDKEELRDYGALEVENL